MKDLKEKKTVQIKITITEDEYNILRELSELQGKPSATVFIDFVRESKTFEILKKVAGAGKVINKWKHVFGVKNNEIVESAILNDLDENKKTC